MPDDSEDSITTPNQRDRSANLNQWRGDLLIFKENVLPKAGVAT
ncbi:hypothetical protein SIL87_00195 [Acidiphilium acidophilum]|uniref:Transposase n=1 Tax=Acidiphilium acidophilum TaxID=76588 RepID=A0AAW9DKG7_ACIAO|nr:hypothetical protein [Acidiphilium acidophilum]